MLFFCLISSFGLNASQTAAYIVRTADEGSPCDRTVWRWYLKFNSGDMSLDVQSGKERLSVIYYQQQIEQNTR